MRVKRARKPTFAEMSREVLYREAMSLVDKAFSAGFEAAKQQILSGIQPGGKK